MTDKGHLEPVHGSIDMVKFENEFDGIKVPPDICCGGHKTLAGGGTDAQRYLVHRPGHSPVDHGRGNPSLMLIAHTPVDDGMVKVWYGLMVHVDDAVPTPEQI